MVARVVLSVVIPPPAVIEVNLLFMHRCSPILETRRYPVLAGNSHARNMEVLNTPWKFASCRSFAPSPKN
jgi:hypothetical protein